jgi:capsule polysaccharide modification protein KpsS
LWVIELLSRSIPATHHLLVKIHKSDAANYSLAQFDRMRSLPGVKLVRPFADARKFIERADLVVAIQGTMGLEAALLGKPVIMLGETPVTRFPSATGIGLLTDLPSLVRRKLDEQPPGREEIIEAYADYLAPFRPASHNDWNAPADPAEPGRFAGLFAALRRHVIARSAAPAGGRA